METKPHRALNLVYDHEEKIFVCKKCGKPYYQHEYPKLIKKRLARDEARGRKKA